MNPDQSTSHQVLREASYRSDLFIGRREELDRCHEFISNQDAIIIHGVRGIGRTWIAKRFIEEWGNQCIEQGSTPSVIFVDLAQFPVKTFESEDLFLTEFAKRMPVETSSRLSGRIAFTILLRSIVEAYPNGILFVIDNVDALAFTNFGGLIFVQMRYCLEWGCTPSMTDYHLWKGFQPILIAQTEPFVLQNQLQMGGLSKSTSSVLNVARKVRVSAFSRIDLQAVANIFGIEASDEEAERLLDLTAGLPYLIRTALDHATIFNESLSSILKSKITLVFSPLVQHMLSEIKGDPMVFHYLGDIVQENAVSMPFSIGYKLASIGLVYNNKDEEYTITCPIFRTILKSHLLS